MIRIPCLVIAASLFLLSSAGCTSLSLPRSGDTSSASVKPARCLCLWQPMELEDASGRPMKGFGGQIYFFHADSEEPVEVDGDVRVFIFDDVGTPEQQARPKAIENFDAITWQSFRGESQFGIHYAVFVPYERASRFESTCSLRVRLARPDGSQVFSEMATVKLPGQSRDSKSIRQLVTPREHSIRPDRSRELRVDLEQRDDTSDRAATIGSIQEGNLSLPGERRGTSRISEDIDDRAQLRIQRYEAQLADMHASFEDHQRVNGQSSTRDLRQEISDLIPAIQQVSGRHQNSRRRVRPSAREVFTSEDSQYDTPETGFIDRARSPTEFNDSSDHNSQTRDSARPGPVIQDFSRPLSRRPAPSAVPDWSESDQAEALKLARIAD